MKKSLKITIIAVVSALIIAGISIAASSAYQNSPEYMLSLAERYLSELDYEQAIVQYERYLAVVPDNGEAWLALADAYEKTGDTEGAKSALERAVEKADSNKAAEKLDKIRKNEAAATVTTTPAVTTTPVVTTTAVTTVTTTAPPISETVQLANYKLKESDTELIKEQLQFMNVWDMSEKDSEKFFLEGQLTEKEALRLLFDPTTRMLPQSIDENITRKYATQSDPFGLFENSPEFSDYVYVFDAASVDNALYCTFGIEPTHEPNSYAYYHNGNYYVIAESDANFNYVEYVNHTETDDGRFIVEYDYYNNTSHNHTGDDCQFRHESWRRYALISIQNAGGEICIRYHAITNDLEGILLTTSADIEVTTAPPVVSTSDPFAIENMLLAYIRGEGSLNVNMLSEVTELRIYGTRFVSVTCGGRKGTTISSTEFSSADDTFISGGSTYSFGNLSDISFVKHCRKLNFLEISYNKVSDISALADLTGLTGLVMRGNRISDISPLKNLTQLIGLNLIDNKITDISAVKGMTGLTDLCISNNSVYDISPLKKLTNLEDFRAEENLIYDISPLKKLKNLKILLLTTNEVEDISALENLKKLKVLGLRGNYVYELNGIEELTKLEVLYLEDDDVQSLEPLYELTNLEQLYLGRNPSISYWDVDELKDYLPDCSVSLDALYSTGSWLNYDSWER